MAEKTYSIEETIGLLKARADAAGDAFMIKLFRKRPMSPIPDCIAVVSEAQVIHAANPEQWVSRLVGGGSFHITMYHMTDGTLPIGGMIPFTLDGQPRNPMASVMLQADWPGPRKLTYPIQETMPPQGTNFTSFPMGGSPSTHVTAPQNTVPGAPLGSPHFIDPRLDQLQRQMEADRAAFTAERERLHEEKRQLEARSAEDRRQADLRSLREENARALSDLKASLGQSKPSGLAEISAVLVPLATQFIAGQQKAAEQAATLAAASQAKTDALLTTLLSRPAIDPALIALMKTSNDDGGQMAHYVDAMAGMSKMSVDLIRTAADIRMGDNPPEHPAMMAIREVAKGLQTIALGTSASLKKKQQQQQPQRQPLPAGAAAQRPGNGAQHPSGNGPIAQGASQHGSQSPQRAAAPQTGFAGAPAGAKVEVIPFTAPAPAPVVESRIWATAGQRIEGPQVIDQLKSMIESHSPINDVALSFIYSINEDEMQTELETVDYSIMELIAKNLGSWALSAEENAQYLRDLADRVMVLGKESGLFEDDDDSDEGDDQNDDLADDAVANRQPEEEAQIVDQPAPSSGQVTTN